MKNKYYFPQHIIKKKSLRLVTFEIICKYENNDVVTGYLIKYIFASIHEMKKKSFYSINYIPIYFHII